MRLPAGSLYIFIWLSFWLLYAVFIVCLNFWQRKRGKWTQRDSLVSVGALVIIGIILAAILWPVYFEEVSRAQRARLHRLYPHRHFED